MIYLYQTYSGVVIAQYVIPPEVLEEVKQWDKYKPITSKYHQIYELFSGSYERCSNMDVAHILHNSIPLE